MNNPDMLTVSLHQIKYHGFHGLYPEEKVIGNDFLIDVEVGYLPPEGTLSLDKLVDYEKLYELVMTRLKQQTDLLEQLCRNIAFDIKQQFPYIKTLRVHISKLHPPLPGELGSSAVSWEENYD